MPKTSGLTEARKKSWKKMLRKLPGVSVLQFIQCQDVPKTLLAFSFNCSPSDVKCFEKKETAHTQKVQTGQGTFSYL